MGVSSFFSRKETVVNRSISPSLIETDGAKKSDRFIKNRYDDAGTDSTACDFTQPLRLARQSKNN